MNTRILSHFLDENTFTEYLKSALAEHRFAARFVPALILGIRIAILLALYVLMDRWISHVGRLPQTAYEQPVIGLELIKHIGVLHLAAAGILGALIHFFGNTIWQPWAAFHHSGPLRIFILLTAGILTWVFSAYGYNFYINQGHYIDRAALFGLALLIYWRPVFVFPFLLLVMAVSWQFEYPFGAGYLQADFYPLLHILMLFCTVFIWHLLTRRPQIDDFVFLTCCLLAANYWIPGIGKIWIDWASHGHVYLMILGAYAHGWLAFLNADTLVSIVQTVAPFDRVMIAGTLLLECGALVCLWRRSVLLAFAGGWILFHLSLFAAFGYFFWKWVLVEIGLIACFLRKKHSKQVPVFTPGHFALALLLIYTSPHWAHPAGLAWHDTRLSYTYRFEAQGESGRLYDLSPRFFAPYSDQFTMNMFGYLSEGPQLVNPYGTTGSFELAQALVRTTSLDQVQLLEEKWGALRFDPQRAAVFDAFIAQFIKHKNRRAERSWLDIMQPLPLLWSFARGTPFTGNEHIRRVKVYQNTSLYDGRQYLDIRKRTVREIDVPAG